MDRHCEHCREPWDVSHITHDAFGSWLNLRAQLETMGDETVKDSEGGFWKFHYDGVDDVAEGHFMILQCPACLPRVGAGSKYSRGVECTECFGSGRVYVKKLRNSDHPILGNWFYKFDPNTTLGPEPYQKLPGFHSADGFVYQGVSHCPKCFESVEEYKAFMLAAGWDLENGTFIEKEVKSGSVS